MGIRTRKARVLGQIRDLLAWVARLQAEGYVDDGAPKPGDVDEPVIQHVPLPLAALVQAGARCREMGRRLERLTNQAQGRFKTAEPLRDLELWGAALADASEVIAKLAARGGLRVEPWRGIRGAAAAVDDLAALRAALGENPLEPDVDDARLSEEEDSDVR